MPSSRTRRAKRLMERIDSRTNERRNAWAEGGRPNTTERLTAQLAKDHEEKRTLRREIYAANPQLEGREVRRSGSDRVDARSSGLHSWRDKQPAKSPVVVRRLEDRS